MGSSKYAFSYLLRYTLLHFAVQSLKYHLREAKTQVEASQELGLRWLAIRSVTSSTLNQATNANP